MKKITFVMFTVILLAGCGKKGALVSPEALAPAPIVDLRVEQKGGQFLVSWSRPGAAEGGGALKDLAGFRVFKREVLPPGEDCEECPTAYRLVTSVDLEYPQGVMVAGNRYLFRDGDLADGKTYRYKVLSVQKNGTMSRTSNRAGRKKVIPPLPVVLKAVSSLEGVVLEWGGAPSPANGRIEGYTIYRKQSSDNGYLAPLNGTPVRETTFEDKRLEWGKRYDYAVRTVSVIDGETVESVPSNEVPGALVEPE
jgi:fibronectin type 3 domain-containing protein/predicted small lipoprotein YifL